MSVLRKVERTVKSLVAAMIKLICSIHLSTRMVKIRSGIRIALIAELIHDHLGGILENSAGSLRSYLSLALLLFEDVHPTFLHCSLYLFLFFTLN